MNGFSRWTARATGGLIAVMLLLPSRRAGGDTLTLNDGTTIDGKVMKQGQQYWIKTADGESKLIPVTEVKSLRKGDAADAAGGSVRTGTSSEFLATRRAVEAMLIAADASRAWAAFMTTHSTSADLPAAQAELDKWKALKDAEKIHGRWVDGADRMRSPPARRESPAPVSSSTRKV